MSLLERPGAFIDAPKKKEISPEQISKGIDLIRPLFDKQFVVEPCELTALHGYINHRPAHESFPELRWDIVQAGYRQEQGLPVDERHLGLFVIRKMLLDVDLRVLEPELLETS